MNEEFRPGFGRGLTVLVALIAAVTAVTVTVTSGLTDALLTLPWLALLAATCWAFFWRPSVVVSDAGVRLVNVTRTIDVPWPAVNDVDTRFALTLETAYGRFRAWAAPAPGAGSALRSSMRMRRPASTDPDDVVEHESSSMGDIAGSASGEAARIVRRRWEGLRDAGFLDDPQLEFDQAPVQWHWRVGATVLGLVVASVATLFMG
ncbi:MAG: PH domain-containing protein [Ilumatobacter sp.]|uniref:PH domain-containing protein n=1 Tax=Ilumatobacter sp. TaxID=1967498 RepID=UPI003C750A3E